MNNKTLITTICSLFVAVCVTGCFGGKAASSSGRGGELVGVGGGRGFAEPAPYGMTKVNRGKTSP